MGKGEEAPILGDSMRQCKEMGLSWSRAIESSSYSSGKVLKGFWTAVI